MSLTLTPLDNVGVEVSGFDIREPISEPLKRELNDLWNEHAILLFRNQDITPERQIEFSRTFGTLALHPLKATRSEANPELFMLENGGPNDRFQTAKYHGQTIVGRLDWHIDLHYTGQPNRGALLRAIELPSSDGLTGFSDLAKAYDALDVDTQTLLDKIEVAYAFCMQRRHMRYVNLDGYEPGEHSPKRPSDMNFPDFPDVAYPGAYTHPVSGRKVLGVVEQFLDRVVKPHAAGLCNDEAIELLERLVAHIKQPEFTYYHEWKQGDMVLWDNWRAAHCATGTAPGVRRVINRTTIEGDVTLGRII